MTRRSYILVNDTKDRCDLSGEARCDPLRLTVSLYRSVVSQGAERTFGDDWGKLVGVFQGHVKAA